MSYRSKSKNQGNGPPAWLVFLVAIALVFGAFYLYQGAQNFLRTGGLGVEEATSRAQVVNTATARQSVGGATVAPFTPRPSFTPIPECTDFRVIVPNAIVRQAPTESSAILGSFNSGEVVCVLERVEDGSWYAIDQNRETRRLDLAYMNEFVIQAVNPTLTPSRTSSPLPTITSAPSETPTITPIPTDTDPPTRTPRVSRSQTVTPEDTPAPTPTEVPPTQPPVQST